MPSRLCKSKTFQKKVSKSIPVERLHSCSLLAILQKVLERHNKPLLLLCHYQKKQKYIDRSWFMQEPPVLNPDWFGEIRLLSKNYLPYYHIKYVQKLCCRLEREMLDNSFWCFICCLILNIGTMFPFFFFSGNIPQFKQFSKIVRRGSAIASTNIFNIQILIRSWSWALLGSILQIIILKSSFVYLIFDRQWPRISQWREKTVTFNNWALF